MLERAGSALMASVRRTGTVSWYDELDGLGAIRPNQGSSVIIHRENLSPGQQLQAGDRVTFLSRPRRGKAGEEAYEIEPAPLPAAPAPQSPAPAKPVRPVPSSAPPAQPSSADDEALRAIASEAIWRRREQQKGRPVPAEAKFQTGTLVQHSQFGRGEVIAAVGNTVSVKFEGSRREVPRDTLVRVEPGAAEPTSTVQAAPKTRPAARLPGKTDIVRLIDDLRSQALERMERQGRNTLGLYHCEPAQEPAVPERPLDIDPLITQAFEEAERISGYYSHQHDARAALLQGQHLVLATPTASGKTACYNPTILEHLLHDPQATALYVFPLIALASDQGSRLNDLNQALPAERRLRLATFNRSVDAQRKREDMRADNRIVITTPESLHYRLLPSPLPNWGRFYQNLRYLVLDEAHMYRGIFGSNVANIVRRVLVRSRREGSPRFPQIVIVSATIRDPRALASQLTGLDPAQFAVIVKSGAATPRRHYLAMEGDVLPGKSVV